MVLFKHEMKQNKKALLIWSLSVSIMSFVCILMFIEMKGSFDKLNEAMSSMGNLTKAYAMDKLDIATMMGYYSVECGNILALGGTMFAAMIGINMLSKEEGGHTAEFLLTHPVSRVFVVLQKYLAMIVQLVVFNIIYIGFSLLGVAIVGESITWKLFILFHVASLVLQVEISTICFAISAYVKRMSMGIGLGLAITLYFINIFANISESVNGFKYLTPFSYADSGTIFVEGTINKSYLLVGVIVCVLSLVLSLYKYNKKDISA